MSEEHVAPGEQSLLDEMNARVRPTEFELEQFPGGMVRVSMELTAELVQQISQFADRNGWPGRDAFVAALANGIGAFEEAEVRELRERRDSVARDRLDVLERRLRQMEVSYAAMKFRTWELLQAYQSANLSDGAMRTQVTALGHLADRLRAENEELRARLKEAEDSMKRATSAAGASADGSALIEQVTPAPTQQAKGLKARLAAFVRAGRRANML